MSLYSSRRRCNENNLQAAVLRIIAANMPDLPTHPLNSAIEKTHECTGVLQTTMLSVDMLVDQIYEDRLIKRDLHGFVT